MEGEHTGNDGLKRVSRADGNGGKTHEQKGIT
jgi:hypothetical protein